MFVYKNKLLSFFFSSPELLHVESVVRVRTSTQNTSMQKVKTNPYRYNFKVLASKMKIQQGRGNKSKISQHLVTEHTNFASCVF